MKAIFQKLGIDNFHETIYEYEAVNLAWWDKEHKTTIEIEAYEGEGDTVNVNIFLCPDVEGVLERTLILVIIFSDQGILEETIVDKRICEQLAPHLAIDFSDEQGAYIVKNTADTIKILSAITGLITNNTPVFVSDLSDEDDNSEDLPYEDGDSLDHFIAMIYINDTPITEAQIVDHIEMGINFEGKEYFNELLSDISTGPSPDLKDQYGLSNEQFELIIDTIKRYTMPQAPT